MNTGEGLGELVDAWRDLIHIASSFGFSNHVVQSNSLQPHGCDICQFVTLFNILHILQLLKTEDNKHFTMYKNRLGRLINMQISKFLPQRLNVSKGGGEKGAWWGCCREQGGLYLKAHLLVKLIQSDHKDTSRSAALRQYFFFKLVKKLRFRETNLISEN